MDRYLWAVTLLVCVSFSFGLHEPIKHTHEKTVADCLLAHSVTPEELSAIALRFGAPAYTIVQDAQFELLTDPKGGAVVAGVTQFDSGHECLFGQSVYEGDVIVQGLCWNVSDSPISFIDHTTGIEFVIKPRELIAIGPYIVPVTGQALMSTTGCSVVCKGDYYACCLAGPPPSCKCIHEDVVLPCDAGGPAATACSITVSSGD